MKQYLDLLRHVRDTGVRKTDRTGTGTLSVFGYQMRFDLARGFPLVTTKKLHTKSIVRELLWFLQGDTNIAYLKEHGVTIWDEWADQNGDLGPVYGKQWRSWPTKDGQAIDQIARAIELIKKDPDSRRIIVNAWNVAELDQMALTPCHALFQFWTRPLSTSKRFDLLADIDLAVWKALDEHHENIEATLNNFGVPTRALSCQLYQRSTDTFLGLPFNVASYALLTHMFAQQCDMAVGEFVWTSGDTHLYLNHLEQADLQLSRDPMPLPTLRFARRPPTICDYQFEDFVFENYQSHPAIKAPIAV